MAEASKSAQDDLAEALRYVVSAMTKPDASTLMQPLAQLQGQILTLIHGASAPGVGGPSAAPGAGPPMGPPGMGPPGMSPQPPPGLPAAPGQGLFPRSPVPNANELRAMLASGAGR